MNTHSAIFLDTETTDTDEPEVVQLGWLDHGDGSKFGYSFERLYAPAKSISWGAMAVHHILPSDVAGLEPHTEAPRDVPPVDFWIGHNIDFDWKALGQPPVRRICTLALCRSLFPETKSHTLSAMAYFLLGAKPEVRELVRQAHGALADVKLCALIYAEIVKVIKADYLPDVWELSEEARIPKIWTFGKFKGEPIEKADRGYANWYRRQPDPDPYLLEALRRARLL